ncbi:hypothetical protein PC119_g13616 [Phytophthora cactorum]|nr:hypothetical protein PC119_g13616 [Phytophthora cactorum]
MEIDEIAVSNSRQRNGSRGSGGRNDRSLTRFRCQKPGHRAAVCRAPAPVLAHVDADTTPAVQHKKNQSGPVGAGRPAGCYEGLGPPVAAQSSSPPVLQAHFNAATTPSDSRLIIVSLYVAGARRPLRALQDSGATKNFFRASCLSVLPPTITAPEGRDEVAVKHVDGKSRRVARREITLPYTFDGFRCEDDFLVIDMNYEFDYILGMSWLSRYQPAIDWLARSVKRRSDFDVSEVFTHVLVVQKDWPHVAVVDRSSTTYVVHRASDGPLCTACVVLLHDDPSQRREGAPTEEVKQGLSPIEPVVEQLTLPPNDAAVEQGLPLLPGPICLVTDADSASPEVNAVSVDSSSRPKSAEPKSARKERFAAQSWEALREPGNPGYKTARVYADVFPNKIPAELPADRGICHEIDLVPGSKYCVTWQWPLLRDEVKAIDEFFESRRKAGHVRDSTSSHSSPTFCVKKATGGWRIVHAFNKLNDATIPAQTPIPRKDMVLDAMSGSEIFSAIDLTDGFYQILMRLSDIPLTAVIIPSGMLWEWLVMPQGLKNASATFNRMVSHVLCLLRDFAPRMVPARLRFT